MKKYPLSETQLGFYFEWMKHPELTEYNVPYLYVFSKKIDVDRLEHAIQLALSKHPIYSIRIAVSDGNVCQYVDNNRTIPVNRITTSEKHFAETVKSLIKPFDLYNDPLVHICIIETENSVSLFFDPQHLVSDGTTLVMLLEEIDIAYCGGEVPDETTTFFDYVLSEKASFQSDAYQVAKDYYQSKFANLSMTKTLNQLSDKIGRLHYVSSFVSFDLVDSFCKTYSLAPNLLLMAAYAFVLSAFSRESKVVFYTVNHGRTERRFRKSFGPFIKSVPVLAHISPEMDVISFIQTMRRELMSGVRYGIYPFNHFCQDLSMVPESSFTFQNNLQELAKLGDEVIHSQALPQGVVDSNISVVVFLLDGKYEIRLEYNEMRHTAFEMAQFVQCMSDCVENMIQHPNVRLGDLPIVSAISQTNLLALSKGEDRHWADATFLELFQKQVLVTPDNIAVVDSVSRMTYSELDKMSTALAAYLLKRGVDKGDFVGVQLHRCKEWITAILAIFKVGAVYLPLSGDYPDERIKYMLEDSGAKVVLTAKDFSLLNNDDSIMPVQLTGQDNAYIIYTSGSTGHPKGVVIQHRALASFLHSCKELYKIDEDSRIFCHSSFNFDASVEDIFPVLTAGGQLHILSDQIVKEPEKIADYIKENALTGGNFTTRFGVEMLRTFELPLTYLTLGGERLEVVPKTRCRLFNSYGPTEFTVDATFFEFLEKEEYPTIPIGRPTPNSRAYVLDEQRRLLPKGCVGELYLAGPQIAAEYWNKPELTAEKFVQNPYSDGDMYGIMYRTGDLVWWNENNQLEYAGRIDKQIKLSGYRIELGEIESCLMQCAGVIQAVADIRNLNGMKRICAYYTAETPLDVNVLYGHLMNELPAYMLPASILYMNSLPLTSNGKIDYSKLPAVDLELTYGNNYVAPATVDEKILTAIAEKIMDMKHIGVETNLFDLGLTSLQAMQIAMEAASLGIHFSVSRMYEKKNIRGFLDKKQELYFWVNEADKDKPLLVLICGYPYYHPFYDDFIAFFKDYYSIFVFESYHEYFLWKSEVSIDILMDFYLQITKLLLVDRPIYAVTGYCMGAELAMHYASRLRKEQIASPKVIMMEGFYKRAEEKFYPDVENNPVVQEHYRITYLLSRSLPTMDYQGEVIIFLAKKLSNRLYLEFGEETNEAVLKEAAKEFMDNRINWKKAYPHTPYFEMDADHWTFFKKDVLIEMQQKIEECWGKDI